MNFPLFLFVFRYQTRDHRRIARGQQVHPSDSSLMTYRGHKVYQTLIRCPYIFFPVHVFFVWLCYFRFCLTISFYFSLPFFWYFLFSLLFLSSHSFTILSPLHSSFLSFSLIPSPDHFSLLCTPLDKSTSMLAPLTLQFTVCLSFVFSLLLSLLLSLLSSLLFSLFHSNAFSLLSSPFPLCLLTFCFFYFW